MWVILRMLWNYFIFINYLLSHNEYLFNLTLLFELYTMVLMRLKNPINYYQCYVGFFLLLGTHSILNLIIYFCCVFVFQHGDKIIKRAHAIHNTHVHNTVLCGSIHNNVSSLVIKQISISRFCLWPESQRLQFLNRDELLLYTGTVVSPNYRIMPCAHNNVPHSFIVLFPQTLPQVPNVLEPYIMHTRLTHDVLDFKCVCALSRVHKFLFKNTIRIHIIDNKTATVCNRDKIESFSPSQYNDTEN